jgi:NAD(P)-dependent dehydrogenase (short-subunit alcohol dehydrogenase family)
LDIIVNNAGYTWDGVLHKMSDAQWQAMIDVHLTAPFRIIRAASSYLRETAKREIAETGQQNREKSLTSVPLPARAETPGRQITRLENRESSDLQNRWRESGECLIFRSTPSPSD